MATEPVSRKVVGRLGKDFLWILFFNWKVKHGLVKGVVSLFYCTGCKENSQIMRLFAVFELPQVLFLS